MTEGAVGAWISVLALLVGSGLTWWVGREGAGGRLERNGVVGIRTRASRASDEAWAAAHVAAGPMLRLTGVGASIATIGVAAIQLVGASPGVVYGAVLVVTGLLLGGVVVAGVTGSRAARGVTSDIG